jgi:hypothetical protein
MSAAKPSPQKQAKEVDGFIEKLSTEIFNAMTAASPDLRHAPQQIRKNTLFMLSYVTLYHAGLLCFEKLVPPATREVFDEELHTAFEKRMGEDPKPHIRRYLQYAEKVGDRGYIQFIGFSIAEALGQRDVLLAVEMCKMYADAIDEKLEAGLRKILP